MKKKLTTVIIVAYLVILLVSMFPVSAKENYETYTYSSEGDILYSPPAYSASSSPRVDAAYMELNRYTPTLIQKYTERFKEMGESANHDATKIEAIAKKYETIGYLQDIVTDSEGYIYLVDRGNDQGKIDDQKGRIIVLDPSYKFHMSIDLFESNVTDFDSFKSPQGVFVNDEYIYVCDTGNERIVMFDRLTGAFHKIVSKPNSALFGTEEAYTPVACAVDQYGRIFVVSSTSTKGIIVLADEEGEFTGFIGAQKVSYSIIDIFWRRFQDEEQRKQNEQNIPTTYNNISIDSEGFVYATLSFPNDDTENLDKQMAAITSKDAAYSPVKKLNAGGNEVMKRQGFFDCGGEVMVTSTAMSEAAESAGSESSGGVSTIVDVAIGPEGSWSIIDKSRSRVYTYNKYGELLFAFGDAGATVGTIPDSGLIGITYQGSNMLLLDGTSKSFTVFTRTEYGDIIADALRMENERNYSSAMENWLRILEKNTNFDAAYIGVGKALYRMGQYEEAMTYFEAAHETTYYSDAYAALRKEWLSKFFILLIVIVIVVLILIIKGLGLAKRFNTKTALKVGKKTYWEELVYAFHLVFHPFDGYWDLKHEKRGSLRAGLTIVGLTIVCFYYNSIGKGYIFDPYESTSSILVQVISIAVPVLLWTTANWCLTTLFDGEGSFKDVLTATCYACAPLPPMLILSTILTNVLTLDEGAIANMLLVFGFIWVAFLLFFGMLVTHDYTLPKNILTTFGTILSMIIIMFVIILFSSLVGKMIQFVSSIVTEISYRV